MAEDLHNLHFNEVINVPLPVPNPAQLKSPACAASADAFRANMHRFHSVLMLPGYIAWVASEWAIANQRAMDTVWGNDKPDPENLEKMRDQFLAMHQNLVQQMNNPPEGQKTMIVGMTRLAETHVFYSRGDFHAVAEDLIKMSLVQGWTAIETLLQDLWAAVIDEQPKYLATLSGKEKVDRKVKLSDLYVFGYDVAHKMGTILKKSFKFSDLDEVRKAYQLAFGCDNQTINNVMASKSLDALAAIRHVIVHQNGRIDDDFVRNSKDVPSLAPLAALGFGKIIRFDGRFLTLFLSSAVRVASELIVAVDDWLEAHPSSQ